MSKRRKSRKAIRAKPSNVFSANKQSREEQEDAIEQGIAERLNTPEMQQLMYELMTGHTAVQPFVATRRGQ